MKIKPIADKIIRDYRDKPFPKDHCACRLPSNTEIKRIIRLARDVIFPGYFQNEAKTEADKRLQAHWRIRQLHRLLKDQISASLLYIADETKNKSIRSRSCELCYRFIDKIPEIREMLRLDLEAHFLGDPAAFNHDQIVVSYPGFYAIMIYRIAHELLLLGIPVLPRMMTEFAHRETGIDINPGARIGKSFFIDHGTGIVIGETTVIGDFVKIYQGVTLGALTTRGGQNLKGERRHPTIGDYVTIYSNASILGKDTIIGNGSTIGSNVFITGSVPANSRVSIKIPELVVKTREEAKGDLRP